MNALQAAQLLLTHYPPEDRSVPNSVSYPQRLETVVAAMNSALQELYGEGGAWMRRDTRGAILNAPTTVSIAVVNGSTAATITGWSSWMEGCGIVISGGSVDNEIRIHTAGGAVTLLFPYDGTTGTQSAVVYGNAVTPDPDVSGILAPVRIPNGPRLAPVTAPDKLLFSPTMEDDFGKHRLVPNPPLPNLRLSDWVGTPQLYCADTFVRGVYDNPEIRLRIAPPPDRAMMIQYRATIAVPTITTADLEEATPPNIPVPVGYAEAIFVPIARKHLLSSHFFREHGNKEEIARAYAAALSIAATLRPQKKSGLTIRPYNG